MNPNKYNEVRDQIVNLVLTMEEQEPSLQFTPEGTGWRARIVVGNEESEESGFGDSKLIAMQELYQALLHTYTEALDEIERGEYEPRHLN